MNTNSIVLKKNRKKTISLVEASGAFDNQYYKSQTTSKGIHPKNFIEHYLTEGWTSGFNPHPCFDTIFYVKNNLDLQNLIIHPFVHFIMYGHREHRFTRADFSLSEYRLLHPEIEANDINPLKHYTLNYGKKPHSNAAVKTLPLIDQLTGYDIPTILAKAKSLKLFDYAWYKNTYNPAFTSELDAFKDYLHKSRFSPVNPSENFDSETYLRCNIDVFHAQISPLFHYLISGKKEGRTYSNAVHRWRPKPNVNPARQLSKDAAEQKIAICLHIYYEDYIERFADALNTFPTQADLFVTLASERFRDHAQETFSKIKSVKKVLIRTVPNRGRNFGPLLVEFSQELLDYDLFCHLHSKKSLYSGREQTQWADYLSEYLLNDCSIVKTVLNAFAENPNFGVYYPTTFWMMPSWVNHVTMNKSYMRKWQDALRFESYDDFLSYPAGGMFWARPKALIDILNKKYTYDDFPSEPIPNDGSMLHALERVIGPVCGKNGYQQFFYHPTSGQLTTDQSYITANYVRSLDSLLTDLRTFSHISFDVFDTLVRRNYSVPDYAKYLLGKDLVEQGIVKSANDFIAIRNDAEFQVRKRMNFKGDVSINDIYEELASRLGISATEADNLLDREFETDLSMITAKDEMVDIFNTLGSHGHILWVISDTYYNRDQIGLILRKVGISSPYRLLVSSAEQKRKDNGTMWDMVKEDLKREGVLNHVHIGDNVVADCQIPGDRGIRSIHILHPYDKWKALGFPAFRESSGSIDEAHILKWGKLINCVGRVPFI